MPDRSSLIAKAKKALREAAEHDALGLAQDPELRVPLVNAARRRFLSQPSVQAFEDWASLFKEVLGSKVDYEDPGFAPWIIRNAIELEVVPKLMTQLSPVQGLYSPLRPFYQREEGRFDRQEIQDQLEQQLSEALV